MNKVLLILSLVLLASCSPKEQTSDQLAETQGISYKSKEEDQNLVPNLNSQKVCLQEKQTFECACLKAGEMTECLSYPGEQITLEIRNKISQWAAENCDEYNISTSTTSMDCP